MERQKAKAHLRPPAGRRPRRAYWLIAKGGPRRMEVFLSDEGATLPVFGFEEEADMFLWLRKLGIGWWPREMSDEELLSLLRDPGRGVGRVDLDPPPALGDGLANIPRYASREDFTSMLAGEDAPCRWGIAGAA